MRQKIKHREKKLHTPVKKTTVNEILPFIERPPQEQVYSNSVGANNNLAASDLFSLFTANIINEKKVFTR